MSSGRPIDAHENLLEKLHSLDETALWQSLLSCHFSPVRCPQWCRGLTLHRSQSLAPRTQQRRPLLSACCPSALVANSWQSQCRRGWRPGQWASVCLLLEDLWKSCVPGTGGVCVFAGPRVGMRSTTPRNSNPVNRNHLGICLSSSQKNRNSLAWVLPTLSVCPTSILTHTGIESGPNLEAVLRPTRQGRRNCWRG